MSLKYYGKHLLGSPSVNSFLYSEGPRGCVEEIFDIVLGIVSMQSSVCTRQIYGLLASVELQM